MHRRPIRRLAVATAATVITAVLTTMPAGAAVHRGQGERPGGGSAPGKVEMGFFEQWGIYSGFTVAAADAEGEVADLTHLDYAFGGVEPLDGATHNAAGALAVSNQPVQTNPGQPGYNPIVCSSLDTWADYQDTNLSGAADVNGGTGVAASGLAGNFEQLAELKAKYPSLQPMMSLGGYNGSAFFSAAAATPASREAFVKSCIDMFIQGNAPAASGLPVTGAEQAILPAGAAANIFDGFDIDWEYPADNNGAPGNLYSPSDTQNFVLLLREFRAQLDALSRTTGRHYQLTVEMPAGQQNAQHLLAAAMARYVDDEVIMDYDFQGPWDATGPTNFESNLYEAPAAPDTVAEPLISVSSTVAYYEQRGVRPSELVVGLPYYGHGWTGVPAGNDYGLYQSATGPAGAGTSDYNQLVNQPGFSWHMAPDAGATWLYNPTTGVFWSIENPAEAYEKGVYISSHGLAGASMWALQGDYQNSLTSALTAGLQQPPQADGPFGPGR